METNIDQEEGLNLVDILNNIKGGFIELKKNWLLLVIVIFITTLSGLIFSNYQKPNFIATSTMMLESSKTGGAMSGALSLASQFGLMGTGSSTEINEDKLIEIIKADKIIKTALLKKSSINSHEDILANDFIDLFGYKKMWATDSSLKNFRFTNTIENLNVLEIEVLKIFIDKIKKEFLTIEKSKSGIIILSVKTKSELFSKIFNEYLVEAITSFYVDRITEKGRVNINIIQNRVDSIAIALRDAEYTLARWKDGSNQLVKAQGMMAEMKLRRNVEVCNSIYIEGIKQLEISKFALLQQTPFLQIIDQPALPLNPTETISKLRGIISGFIFGCILSGLIIYLRKKYTETMIKVNAMSLK